MTGEGPLTGTKVALSRGGRIGGASVGGTAGRAHAVVVVRPDPERESG